MALDGRSVLLLALLFASAISTILPSPATGSPAQAPAIQPADPGRFLDTIKILTEPAMQGRGDGTRGLTRAAYFVQRRYKELGLAPGGRNDYFQPFRVVTGAKLVGRNSLQEQIDGKRKSLALNKDFIPFSFSSSGKTNAAAAFVGYGISAPEFGYDDYSGIDVRGKVVVLLRFEPLGFARLSGYPEMTMHADILTKAMNAKNHGASAVILLNGVLGDGEEDSLAPFESSGGPANIGIEVLQVENKVAEAWFRAAGKSLEETENQFDATSKPASFPFPESLRLVIRVGVRPTRATLNNVLAYLPGQTPEYIVVGAHYDHLGYGPQGSHAPAATREIYPGADDNASGTAGLLELARMFAPLQGRLRRGILFASFAGEEIGALGSADWVDKPTRPLPQAIAMINMDMIGRIQDGKIYVGGVGTGSTFQTILAGQRGDSVLQLEDSAEDYAASDQASFAARRIPALFFSSGLNPDYHKPTDTWDKINSTDAAHFLDLLAALILRLNDAPARPTFAAAPDLDPAATNAQ